MVDGRKLLDKITGGKKLEKDQCLIIILVGVLLCVTAIPIRKNNSESNISYISNNTINHNITEDENGTSQLNSDVAETYAEFWERKLEETLACVDGVGKVRVLISLKESERRIVEKDGSEEYSDTEETDAAGGSRTIGESRIEKSTIYTVDENGKNVPYVSKTIPPAVEGVVVIAQGGRTQSVQDNIIDAIQVLFNIDANKIKIVEMKNNQ